MNLSFIHGNNYKFTALIPSLLEIRWKKQGDNDMSAEDAVVPNFCSSSS